MDELNGTKPWKCPHGHVLGLVERVRMENGLGQSRHISRLLLYRHALDPEQARPTEVDVIGALEGTMLRIRCDVCGETRTWMIGQDAIERLKNIVEGKWRI